MKWHRGRVNPENTELKCFQYFQVERSGEAVMRGGWRVLRASGLRGYEYIIRRWE